MIMDFWHSFLRLLHPRFLQKLWIGTENQSSKSLKFPLDIRIPWPFLPPVVMQLAKSVFLHGFSRQNTYWANPWITVFWETTPHPPPTVSQEQRQSRADHPLKPNPPLNRLEQQNIWDFRGLQSHPSRRQRYSSQLSFGYPRNAWLCRA